MATLISMSESIQASVIIQHQLQQQLQQQSRHDPALQQQLQQRHQEQHQQQQKGIGLCVQILLVASLCGIEMCAAFEQIYEILFLQYLGVPVSLVSVNGIICGSTSMVLLPAVGYLADKGSNPKLRKLMSLFLGMAVFLCGLTLLAACGVIKLTSIEAIFGSQTVTSGSTDLSDWTTLWPTQVSSANITDQNYLTANLTSGDLDLETAGTPSETGDVSSSLPVTVFMSIAGFACIDVGFDIGVSLTRAFILECVPPFQHTRLLVMATITQAMAGTAFCLIGCFDLPGILGPIFHTDGVAVTLVFLCGLLFCIIIIGCSLTTITGFCISRGFTPSEKKAVDDQKPESSARPSVDLGTPRIDRRKWYTKRQSQLQQLYEDRPYQPDIIHTQEGDPSTKPLLHGDSLKNNSNYSAISVSGSSLQPQMDVVDIGLSSRNCYPPKFTRSPSTDSNIHADPNASQNFAQMSEFENLDVPQYEHQPVDNGVSAVMAAIRQSYSLSVSVMQPPLGHFHSRKLAQLQNQKESLESAKKKEKKIKLNRRLIILCISAFFGVGSLLGSSAYTSNALNIGILHGDPTALPGTEGYEQYQLGLRTGALGNLVLYASYMLISLTTKKLIDIIGERGQFVLSHIFLIVSLATLLITRLIEVYFIFMVFYGTFRNCVFTLPFVLANKFTQEEAEGETTDPSKPVKNIGKIMSLIGFLLPCHFICMSIFMGPLMDVTGNVWVPLVYSLCCASTALLVFSSLFFIMR